MTVTIEDQPKPKLRVQWPKLIGGVTLAVMVLWALKVDLGNNWSYGNTISHEAALVAALCAFGVAALPIVAQLYGRWTLILQGATAACVAGTIACAFLAYKDKQNAELMARSGKQATYANAQRDADAAREEAKQAREEANKISEPASVADLEDMAARARKTHQDAENFAKGQGLICARNKRCREASTALDGVSERLGKARMKQAELERAGRAEERVNKLKVEAKDGPADAGTFAHGGVLSIVNALFIAATVMIGLLGEQAIALVQGAFTWDQPKPVKLARSPVVKKAEPVALTPTAKGLPGFLALCKHGEQTPQKDIREAVDRYWVTTKQPGPPPSDRALGMAIVKHGFEKVVDRQKRVSYAIKLPDTGLKLVAGLDG